MAKITFTDKVNNSVSVLTANKKVSAADMNEIKESVNALYDGLASNVIYINVLADLGMPSGGVYTLEANKTYIVTAAIDLLGSRIVAGGVCNLFGLSSEVSSLTSTGLANGTAMITSAYTIVIENITLKDVDTCLAIDGNSRTVALDWENVNFSGIPNVGVINTCDNFILDTSAFLGAQGLRFTGTVGTIGINNTLLRGTGSAGNIIELDASAIVTRRFRIIYSSIIAVSSTVGVNVNASATIPIEGYILDTVNFSGGGTYVSGTTYTSEKALFVNNVGIVNTTAIGNMYMKNNAVATDIVTQNVRYNIAGTTESNGNNQKFTHIPANNSMRYDSTITRLFRVLITFTMTGGNNNVVGSYVGVKRGESIDPDTDRISESEVYITLSGTKPDVGAIQALVSLDQDDEVYMIVQNTTNNTDVTVQFLNMIIERTN